MKGKILFTAVLMVSLVILSGVSYYFGLFDDTIFHIENIETDKILSDSKIEQTTTIEVIKEHSPSSEPKGFMGGIGQIISDFLGIGDSEPDMVMGMASKGEEEKRIIKTPYTTEEIIGYEHRLVFHGFPQNVWEDGEWKDYKEIESLKGKEGWGYNYEFDGIHEIEVIDFNATSRKLSFSLADSKELSKDIPVKVGGAEVENVRFSTMNDKLSYEFNGDSMEEKVSFGSFSSNLSITAASEIYDAYTGAGGNQDNNYGGRDLAWVDDDQDALNAYLRLNYSSIPSNAEVSFAEINLTSVDDATSCPEMFTLGRVLRDWGEGSQNGAQEVGSITWNSPKHTQTSWTINGSKGIDTDVAGDDLRFFYCSETGDGKPININGTQHIADVQGWVNGTYESDGYVFFNVTTNNLGFSSSEQATESLRPKGSVIYTANAIPTAYDIEVDPTTSDSSVYLFVRGVGNDADGNGTMNPELWMELPNSSVASPQWINMSYNYTTNVGWEVTEYIFKNTANIGTYNFTLNFTDSEGDNSSTLTENAAFKMNPSANPTADNIEVIPGELSDSGNILIRGIGTDTDTANATLSAELWMELPNSTAASPQWVNLSYNYTDNVGWEVTDYVFKNTDNIGSYNFTFNLTDDFGSFSSTLEKNAWFNMTHVSPSAPDLNLPENDTTFAFLGAYPDLNWSNVTAAYTKTYYLLVDNDADFSSPAYTNASIAETANTTGDSAISGLLEQKYFWKTLVFDTYQNSTWSDTREFTMKLTPLLSFETDHKLTIKESSTNTYRINASYEDLLVDSVTAQLVYNETAYSMAKEIVNSTKAMFSTSLTTPILGGGTNFYYNFSTKLENASYWYNQTQNYTQTVSQMQLYNCSEGNATDAVVVNYTWYDETDKFFSGNDVRTNATMFGTVKYWEDDSSIYRNLTFVSENNTDMFKLCMPINDAYQVDATLEYVYSAYDYRRHYYRNKTLDNITDEEYFYLLSNTDGTGVTINVKGDSDNPLSGYYVEVERQNVADGLFTPVSHGLTNDDGDSYMFLRYYDAFFRFKVYKYDTLQYTTSTTQIDSSPFYIVVGPTFIEDVLDDFEGITYSLTNTTNKFTLSYSDSSGSSTSNCLAVTRLYKEGKDYVYHNCLTTSSGSMSYTINTDETGEYTATYISVIPKTYRSDESGKEWTTESGYQLAQSTITVVSDILKLAGKLGGNGLFATVMLSGTLAFAGLFSTVAAVVFLLIGLIASAFMGLFYTTNTYLTILGIAAVGIFVIAKLKR